MRRVRGDGGALALPAGQVGAALVERRCKAALAAAEPFFAAPFPENRGARLRISGGCPARGEPEALTKLCSSIAC